jgi:hypothetical protein
LVVTVVIGLAAACVLCIVVYLFGARLQVFLGSLLSRRLATIDIGMWDDAGQPEVLVSKQIDSPGYDLQRITPLSILMATQDQMRRMSSASQDMLEGGLQRLVREFEVGNSRPQTPPEREPDWRRVGTLRIVVFEGHRPYQMHVPPVILQAYPRWAPDVEQACAVAVPLFIEHELALLPTQAQEFVIEGLNRQLARWEEERPKLGEVSRDWDYLSRWSLQR